MSKSGDKMQSLELIPLINDHRKVFVWVSIAAIVVSVAVSLILPNKYKSEIVLFAVPNVSVSKALLNTEGSAKDRQSFGDEDEADQLLQVLQSDRIRDKIINKYGLMDHYEIKPDDPHKFSKLHKKFKSNFSFERNKYMAVEVSVVDENPQMAADMANDIGSLLDSVMNQMKQAIARPDFEIVKKEYLGQKAYIKALQDSISVLNKLGVQAYESQVEVLSDKLAEAYLKNNQGAVKKIQSKLDTIAKYGGSYESISEELEFERERLSELKVQYNMAKINAQRNVEHKFLVNRAAVPDKKHSPVRSLIVIGSLLSAWLLTLVLIIIRQGVNASLDKNNV